MRELTALVQREEGVQEAARDSHMARSLTALLASTHDSAMLDAISALLAALSGSGVHTSRLVDCTYDRDSAGTAPLVVKVSECALREGVGSRLWGISHTFNMFLIDSARIQGRSVVELGSGVGSTGTCHPCCVQVTGRYAGRIHLYMGTYIRFTSRCLQVSLRPSWAQSRLR